MSKAAKKKKSGADKPPRAEIDRKQFLKAVQAVARVCPRKSFRPILSCVLLDWNKKAISIRGTDMETSLRLEVDVKSTGKGQAVVPVYLLSSIINSLPTEAVTLSKRDGKLVVEAGRDSFDLLGENAEDFPDFIEPEDGKRIEMDAKELRILIEKTSFAASAENTRYALKGAQFSISKGRTSLVATNGKMLAYTSLKTDSETGEFDCIVPASALTLLAGVLKEAEGELEVSITENVFSVTGSSLSFHTRLIEGNFPDWQAVVPKSFEKTLKIDPADFASLVKRACLCGESPPTVRISIEGSTMLLSSRSPDVGAASVKADVEYKGEDIEIAFNSNYLLEILGSGTEETVIVKMKDDSSPALLEFDAEHFCVLMPDEIS